MTTNTKTYQQEYMKKYRQKEKSACEICGNMYRSAYKYSHVKSKGHKRVLDFINSFGNLS